MRAEIETNYLGPVALIRAFAPVLKGERRRRGRQLAVGGRDRRGAIDGRLQPVEVRDARGERLPARRTGATWTTLHALIVGSVDTRMAEHVTWQAKSTPRDIGRAGLTAVKHGIDEHDTDPHAVSVRAFLARDPATLKKSMAAGLANPDGRR